MYLSVLQRNKLSCVLTFPADDRELDLSSRLKRGRRSWLGIPRASAAGSIGNSEENF